MSFWSCRPAPVCPLSSRRAAQRTRPGPTSPPLTSMARPAVDVVAGAGEGITAEIAEMRGGAQPRIIGPRLPIGLRPMRGTRSLRVSPRSPRLNFLGRRRDPASRTLERERRLWLEAGHDRGGAVEQVAVADVVVRAQ